MIIAASLLVYVHMCMLEPHVSIPVHHSFPFGARVACFHSLNITTMHAMMLMRGVLIPQALYFIQGVPCVP
jgi:hypothetical protein